MKYLVPVLILLRGVAPFLMPQLQPFIVSHPMLDAIIGTLLGMGAYLHPSPLPKPEAKSES